MQALHAELRACVDNLAHYVNAPSLEKQLRIRQGFEEFALLCDALTWVQGPLLFGLREEVRRMRQKLEQWSDWQLGVVDDRQFLADLDNGVRSLNAHWAALIDRALRTVTRQSREMEMRQSQLLKEAKLGLYLWSGLAMTYMLIVQVLLTWPVGTLARAMRAVSRGDLQARADVRGTSPVARLAQDSNQMVDALVSTLSEQEQTMAELRKANDELMAANRHKNMFLATVSHELKTPLNAIIGFADILSMNRDQNLTPKQQDFVARMHAAGEHLRAMISDLIDIAKIDVDAVELVVSEFDLAGLVHEVQQMMVHEASKKGIELEVRAPEEALLVRLDRTRMKQVVVNLMANAVKFTPENSAAVTVSCATKDGAVSLQVIDRGIGIPVDEQERIFDVFVQGDARLQRQHEGVGLGLALTKRLVTLMGGEIAVESAPGKGATFEVTVPLETELNEERTDR